MLDISIYDQAQEQDEEEEEEFMKPMLLVNDNRENVIEQYRRQR